MRSTIRAIAIGLFSLIISASALGDAPADWPLNQVVLTDDFDALRVMLASAKWTQEELNYALVAAAGKGRPNAARILLRSGADPNFRIPEGGGYTAVIVAVRRNQPETLDILLSGGGNPNAQDNLNWRPLHHAVLVSEQYLDVIRILIANGANVDGRDGLQRTALHRAAGFGHTEAVELLLQNGADASLREKYGRTAEERAARGDHHTLARLLGNTQEKMNTGAYDKQFGEESPIIPGALEILVLVLVIGIPIAVVGAFRLRYRTSVAIAATLIIGANALVRSAEGRPYLESTPSGSMGQVFGVGILAVLLGFIYWAPSAAIRRFCKSRQET